MFIGAYAPSGKSPETVLFTRYKTRDNAYFKDVWYTGVFFVCKNKQNYKS